MGGRLSSRARPRKQQRGTSSKALGMRRAKSCLCHSRGVEGRSPAAGPADPLPAVSPALGTAPDTQAQDMFDGRMSKSLRASFSSSENLR